MIGRNIAESSDAFNEAKQRVRQARLIFTTCVGAGLGLLRSENFDTVLIDNAARQVEPESLIPLTKGCRRAVIMGDHAGSRVRVSQHAMVVDFDLSLFERHFKAPTMLGIAKTMLDTQYGVHPQISGFSSSEYYGNELRTVHHETIPPSPRFCWLQNSRMVFLQSDTPEDLGSGSKSNRGQSELCRRLLAEFQNTASTQEEQAKPMQVVILTPYTRQKDLIMNSIPTAEVYTVDEFQDRVADVVIFVSVRCNAHFDTGRLLSTRCMYRVLTGAKMALFAIGDRVTLTKMRDDCRDTESSAIWARFLSNSVHGSLAESETWSER